MNQDAPGRKAENFTFLFGNAMGHYYNCSQRTVVKALHPIAPPCLQHYIHLFHNDFPPWQAHLLHQAGARQKEREQGQSMEKLCSGSTPAPPSTPWDCSNSQTGSEVLQLLCKHWEVFCMGFPFVLSPFWVWEEKSRSGELATGCWKESSTEIWYCPEGMGEVAEKFDMIDAQK